jgi:GNAT superfamily N-acetyltransferase
MRGAVRKAFFPLLAYERFLVLRAPIGPGTPSGTGSPVCMIENRQRPFALAEADWADGHETIRRWFEDGRNARLRLAVARDGKGIVGVCLFEMDVVGIPGAILRAPVRSYFVHFIGVHERARGRGVMARLLECADCDALAEGARWRLCLVASHNRASLRGFAKSGATAAGSVMVIRILGRPLSFLPAWLRSTP